MTPFIDSLYHISKKNNSLLCVGLDPHLDKIPQHLNDHQTPIFYFNKAIIDATSDLVCSYKLQIAYYSAFNAENELILTIDYIHENYFEIPVILDAKRGDIGATSSMYVEEVFSRYKADAVTINPYMGTDTVQPFTDRKEKGVIILCRTSNPHAKDLQDLITENGALYEIVAKKAVTDWNENHNVLLVVGATCPDVFKKIRAIVGDMWLLVPGVGAQGGTIEDVMENGQNGDGNGLIISASRNIIYAGDQKDFDSAARARAQELRDEINIYR